VWRRSRGDDDEDDRRALTPEEEAALQLGLERVQEEKRQALLQPGPTWREWFLYDAMKWWLAILYLIVDSWIVVAWIGNDTITLLTVTGTLLSLALAFYLEILLYRYLWRRPDERETAGRERFHPGWLALREAGIWTPEASVVVARDARRGPEDGAPDPHEFL
jgi:hypothetical protein